MKTIGLIGGLAWPSTANYYRLLCSRANAHFEQRGSEPPFPTPHLIIDSLNINATRKLHGRDGDETSWVDYDAVFRESFQRLARAGAEFGAIASNTPHTRMEGIRQGLDFPLVSILDATAEQAEALSSEALVLGTPVTMRHQAYPRALQKRGVTALPPPADESIDRLGHLIDDELCEGHTDTAQQQIVQICRENLRDRDTAVVCLACTELPLAFPEFVDVAHFRFAGIRFINTIVTHVEAILREALRNTEDENS
ncbi:MAG: aspartate/glutamate racemase family protein [Gammaproteobacteria bacterium]|nr:aspartate/glutamate racemase family protein [Gammaproteobacteria bacterium]